MHVVQTTAAPPNHGRICLARTGWTRKTRKALAAWSGIARFCSFSWCCPRLRGVRGMVSRALPVSRRLLYSPGMFANLVRLALAAELAAWAALGAWAAGRFGWSAATVAAAAAGGALAVRLLLVGTTLAISWASRSPRAPQERLGL